MSKKRERKTQGLEWLYLSMGSFNGSGYANKTNGETYATSYVQYKMWRKLPNDAQVALNNWEEAVKFGEHLCEAKDGHKPSDKNYQKFINYINGATNQNNTTNYDLFSGGNDGSNQINQQPANYSGQSQSSRNMGSIKRRNGGDRGTTRVLYTGKKNMF